MKKENKYKHGLKVPENYFEDFEDRLHIKILEESLPKESGFSVPKGYMESLDGRILEMVKQDAEVKVVPLYKRKALVYIATAAACLALVFSIFTNPGGDEVLLEIADIEAYFEQGGLDYSSYDVAQLLNEDELDELSLDNSIFGEENLEDYILDNLDLDNLDDTTLLIE